MAMGFKGFVAIVGLACCLALTACATAPGGPGVSFSNTDQSDGRRAETRCRADAGAAGVGATAAYEACMARFRRPPDDE